MELHCQKLAYQIRKISLMAPKLVPDTQQLFEEKKKHFLKLILGILR
jgi:hypothetical protein